MQKDVLEKKTRILGGEHPETILAMDDLAVTYRMRGKLVKVTSIRKKVLGYIKRMYRVPPT